MKIVLHGTLADKFGREFTIATETPADAIEGLSRQLPDWPRDLPIDCVGYDTPEKLRAATDAEVIHLMPAMYGGGGKWGQIIIGAAMIAVAIAIPGIGTIAGMSINAMLFTTGAAMMLSGVSQLFLSAPTVNKSSDPPASKYFGVNANTTAIGTLITQAWGRIKLSGQWLSIQADSSDLVTTSFPATTS